MNIEDNWFSKALAFKLLAQNQSAPTLNNPVNDKFSQLFSAVLDQLMTGNDDGATVNPLEKVPLPTFSSSVVASTVTQDIKNGSASTVSEGSLRFQSVDPKQLDMVLGGKLSGKGEAFVRAGEWYNINPSLLAAISQHETGNGTSHAANVKNNIAGMMGVNGLKSYSTVEESIMDMARNLSKNYLDKGLSTVPKIAAKYAPIGAGNDPTNLNQHWVSGVSKYLNQIFA